MQLRRDHPCVVEDEDIAAPQQARQVAHRPVRKGRRPLPAWLDDQHPRCVARAGGAERDQALGELEVEFVDAHLTGTAP